ncbi:hypothetical protein [Actinospica robiniae]|uniref:hypothetical protein n=1 Tax=Actinospica robiniae TaxID=304901 RepID=UPI00041BE3FB|nr:hypothetical protein [Actinospica robiniae]
MTVRPAAQRLDLRKTDVPDVLARVKAALQAAVCDEGPETYVRKRRSIGFRTERNTWVRIECRGRERLDGQAWGLESAAAIREVPIPTWHAGLSWLDTERDVMWRADETAYIDQAPIGRASNAPGLPPSWWAACNAALGELARHPTARNATPDLEPINAARVGAAITKVFPECAQVSLDEWTTAHADLNWANMTGPTLWILDWEDWGRAPRGLDAANLWAGSLALPAIAATIYELRRADLESPTGKLMRLFKCAELLAWADEREPLYAPSRREAARLLAQGVGQPPGAA